MRKIVALPLALGAAALLSGCETLFGSDAQRPDEFAVARNAPLTIPPDYTLVPPKPGDPRPQAADAQAQALEALFGGTAPRSAGETVVLGAAGRDDAESVATIHRAIELGMTFLDGTSVRAHAKAAGAAKKARQRRSGMSVRHLAALAAASAPSFTPLSTRSACPSASRSGRGSRTTWRLPAT